MLSQRKVMIGAALALASVSVAWTMNSGEIWLKGRVYVGSAKAQLSNDAGVLAPTGITLGNSGITLNGTNGANDINLVDNLASAADFTESTNSYMNFTTTNGAEKVIFGRPFRGTLSTVAAAGSVQGDAGTIAAGSVWVTVTAADGTKGVTLPSGSSSTCVRVMSQVVGSVLKVYGLANDTVNGGSANAAYSQLGGTALDYCTSDGVAWFSY